MSGATPSAGARRWSAASASASGTPSAVVRATRSSSAARMPWWRRPTSPSARPGVRPAADGDAQEVEDVAELRVDRLVAAPGAAADQQVGREEGAGGGAAGRGPAASGSVARSATSAAPALAAITSPGGASTPAASSRAARSRGARAASRWPAPLSTRLRQPPQGRPAPRRPAARELGDPDGGDGPGAASGEVDRRRGGHAGGQRADDAVDRDEAGGLQRERERGERGRQRAPRAAREEARRGELGERGGGAPGGRRRARR